MKNIVMEYVNIYKSKDMHKYIIKLFDKAIKNEKNKQLKLLYKKRVNMAKDKMLKNKFKFNSDI